MNGSINKITLTIFNKILQIHTVPIVSVYLPYKQGFGSNTIVSMPTNSLNIRRYYRNKSKYIDQTLDLSTTHYSPPQLPGYTNKLTVQK